MIVSMVLSHTKFVRGLEPLFLREGVGNYEIVGQPLTTPGAVSVYLVSMCFAPGPVWGTKHQVAPGGIAVRVALPLEVAPDHFAQALTVST